MTNNSRIASVLAYISWVGFLIAMIIRDRSDSYVAHHMNQALVINLLSIVSGVLAILPMIGGIITWLASIAVLVFGVMGIYRAATGSTEPLPFIGDIHIIG